MGEITIVYLFVYYEDRGYIFLSALQRRYDSTEEPSTPDDDVIFHTAIGIKKEK